MFFIKTPAGVFPLIPIGDSLNRVEFFGQQYVINKMALHPINKDGTIGEVVPLEVFHVATPKRCPNIYEQQRTAKKPTVVLNEGGFRFGGVTVKVVLRD